MKLRTVVSWLKAVQNDVFTMEEVDDVMSLDVIKALFLEVSPVSHMEEKNLLN